MQNSILFKNESDRERAMKVLKKYLPDMLFVKSDINGISGETKEIIVFGKWEVNLFTGKILYDGKNYSVSREENEIIKFLMENIDQVYTAEEISYALNFEDIENTILLLDNFIDRVEAEKKRCFIKNVNEKYYVE